MESLVMKINKNIEIFFPSVLLCLAVLSCGRDDIGEAYPAEPRIEFSDYHVAVSDGPSDTTLVIRWIGCEEAVYTLLLTSPDTDQTKSIPDNSTVDARLVHSLNLSGQVLLEYANSIGQPVTPENAEGTLVVLSVSATAKDGSPLCRYADYTQTAAIHLVPEP